MVPDTITLLLLNNFRSVLKIIIIRNSNYVMCIFMVVDILRIILCAEMVKELRVGTNPKKRKKNGKIGEKISGTKKN